MTATPLRNIRVDDATWKAMREQAAREGRTVSEITRELYRDYLAQPA